MCIESRSETEQKQKAVRLLHMSRIVRKNFEWKQQEMKGKQCFLVKSSTFFTSFLQSRAKLPTTHLLKTWKGRNQKKKKKWGTENSKKFRTNKRKNQIEINFQTSKKTKKIEKSLGHWFTINEFFSLSYCPI